MKVKNMKNSKGQSIANQFVIGEEGHGSLGNFNMRLTFQSYDSIIAIKTIWNDRTQIELDEYFWDYSKTTGKYRNRFLGELKRETQQKIDSGEYKLTNLN